MSRVANMPIVLHIDPGNSYHLSQNTSHLTRHRVDHQYPDAITHVKFMRPYFTRRTRSFCVKQREESGATHC
ncbi:hypothetical protein BDI4_590056 [Burkholderia diffusa]|nr:hypothetical protein BDI4_590056 [Burkholderia diffusa]